MEHQNDMEALLWAYIDGSTDASQTAFIEKLIQEQAEWRACYQELLSIHSSIGQSVLEEPSMRFTKNVMEEISKLQIAPATRQYINNRIIWGIGLFFITMFIGFIIYGIGQIDWTAASSNSNRLGLDLGQVDYSKMFNNSFMNLLLMMNVILGLFLLDRFLSNRNKNLREQL